MHIMTDSLATAQSNTTMGNAKLQICPEELTEGRHLMTAGRPRLQSTAWESVPEGPLVLPDNFTLHEEESSQATVQFPAFVEKDISDPREVLGAL